MHDARPSSASRRAGHSRPVLSARAGAALGVVVVLVAILALPFREWVTQRSRISELSQQVAWHEQRVTDLAAAKERWQDPAYVAAEARVRLQFVRPGEVGYVVLTDQSSQEQEATSTRPMVTAPTGGPWWAAMWSTVQASGAVDPDDAAPEAPAPATAAPTYGG